MGLISCDVCGVAGDYDTVNFPLFHFSILKEVLDKVEGCLCDRCGKAMGAATNEDFDFG